MFSLISQAFAETVAAPTSPAGAPAPQGTEALSITDVFNKFGMWFAVMAVLYFFMLRPQQKKYNEHKAMMEGLRRGDKVVTGGGFVGTIVRVEEGDVVVELAPNLNVTVLKSSIQSVNARTEAVPAKDAKKD